MYDRAGGNCQNDFIWQKFSELVRVPFFALHVASYSLKKMDILVREPLGPMVPWKMSAGVLVKGTMGRPLLISGL